MVWGYAATVGLVTAGFVLSVRPLARSGPGGVASWLLTHLVNESPLLATGYLLLATVATLPAGDPRETGVLWWLLVGCAGLTAIPVLLRRGAAAGPVLAAALDDGLGRGWQGRGADARSGWRAGLPWWRILVWPVPLLPGGVRRRRDRYGPDRRHRVDVYRGRSPDVASRPVLIHLHGGGFTSGRTSLYARPLLHAFARHGWVTLSAGYRLRPATYPDMLDDIARLLAWTRRHAVRLGADPDRVVLAGSSAGAHLALTTALTVTATDGPRGAGTPGASVIAAIGLYGYYGPVDHGGPPSEPVAHAHSGAPPVMIVHGGQDTFVPAGRARQLSDVLRAESAGPVVYAEVPGAQHTFDLLHSLRFELVVDALWSFATWASARPGREC